MYTSLKRAVCFLLMALAFYGFCNPSMADPSLKPTSTPIVLGQQYSISSIFSYVPDKAPNGSPVLGVIAGFLPSPGVTFSGLPLHFDGFYLYCVAGDTTKLAAPCSSSGTVVFTSPASISGSLQFWYLQDPTNPNSGFVQSDPANYTFNFGPTPPPSAKNQTATTGAGVPVTTDLSVGATGNPTSAAIVSRPAHGAISAISGTKVTYTPTACFVGRDSFQFTLANGSGTSNVATATTTVTAAAPTTNVHLVDPFLLRQNLSNIDLTPLYNAQNWSTVQAKGLVADDTSAAIAVIQTNDCNNAVTFSTTNGTTLLPYMPNFLTTKPVAGRQSLPPIPAANLLKIGGLLYAAVLVQTPVGTPAPSFTAPIVVTAKQGTRIASAQMAMVPPPIVLVHGIWGDQNSLHLMASHLIVTPPWKTHPELIQVLCYSKYFAFDAAKDPRTSTDQCEQTSRDGIFKSIYALKKKLDSEQFVGSRVDIVAHSMGGLAARWYASQESYTPGSYRYLRNRKQGEFHEVITLNTPELGSLLANFLFSHSSCTRKVNNPTSYAFLVWYKACGLSSSITVAQCFAKQGIPLAAPDFDPTTGAVYSLFPGGPSLKNSKLSGPNIAGAKWLAVSSIAPDNSALEFELNKLIAAIYPSNTTTCNAPAPAQEINQILRDPRNDAIVTIPSQLAGVKVGQSHTFQGLSHTPAPAPSVPGKTLSDANVLVSPDVNRLVGCWLSRAGDSGCLAGIPASLTQVSIAKADALPTPPANKNAVPMPQIVVDHPKYVERLTLSIPTRLELGTPFDLAVNTGSSDLPQLEVGQSSETGKQVALPVTISRVEGHIVHLSVMPTFFGKTQFQVSAAYRDGGIAFKDFTATVNLPSMPPTEFHADALPFAGTWLDLNIPIRLQPWAIYANIPGRVNLDARYVSYSVVLAAGLPVVRLDPNGVVYGLRPGTATIVGRFGALTDQVEVTVEADASH